MTKKSNGSEPEAWLHSLPDDVASDLLSLMTRDLVFSMRFLGESQYRLQGHFQDFIRGQLSATGVTEETHPMIHLFIENHAMKLRDFVLAGVALSHQFRLDEMERLTGDTTSIMRVDIWDQLKSHIETAESQFTSQIGDLQSRLRAFEAPAKGRQGDAS